MSCNCNRTPCGCGDSSLRTGPTCPPYECPSPQCEETFSDCCVIHNYGGIVDLGIIQGMPLCEILQILTLAVTNPTCVGPSASCLSPLNLLATSVTPTSISISWSNPGTPTSLQTQYKTSTAVTWTSNSVLPGTSISDSIGVLLPNTEYYIRVISTCTTLSGSTSCNSVTISVTTRVTPPVISLSYPQYQNCNQ